MLHYKTFSFKDGKHFVAFLCLFVWYHTCDMHYNALQIHKKLFFVQIKNSFERIGWALLTLDSRSSANNIASKDAHFNVKSA